MLALCLCWKALVVSAACDVDRGKHWWSEMSREMSEVDSRR